MDSTLNSKAEKIKSKIKETAEKSKDAIRKFIDSNRKQVGVAIDSNKKIVDSINEKMGQELGSDKITDNVKDAFGKSVALTEDALDGIINSYTKQMEMNVDYSTQLIDTIKDSKTENPEKVLDLIQKNFEDSHQMALNNTKEMLDFYSKHTNLAVNFNAKFGEVINSQIESLFKIHGRGVNRLTDWASEWWKEEGR